jgi:hypothetical protein
MNVTLARDQMLSSSSTFTTIAAVKPFEDAKPNQAKVLTGGGDLREAQVDVRVLLSVSHSRV